MKYINVMVWNNDKIMIICCNENNVIMKKLWIMKLLIDDENEIIM